MYQYYATVGRVVDGDTVDLEVDLGFHMVARIRFRLTGINAPEMSTVDGPQAKMHLQSLLPVGTSVRITTAKADKYGRWLAVIYDQRERSVNQLMLDAGHAVRYMV
jgi:micrococcal nuclease